MEALLKSCNFRLFLIRSGNFFQRQEDYQRSATVICLETENSKFHFVITGYILHMNHLVLFASVNGISSSLLKLWNRKKEAFLNRFQIMI